MPGRVRSVGLCCRMPDFRTATRPTRLVFKSLAELYEQYEALFLQGHEYRQDLVSRCGLRVTAFDRSFLHMVKLSTAGRVKFNIQDEKPRIRSERDGFGPYTIDEARAHHLPSALDTLLKPHHVFELPDPQTADLGFLKHCGKRGRGLWGMPRKTNGRLRETAVSYAAGSSPAFFCARSR